MNAIQLLVLALAAQAASPTAPAPDAQPASPDLITREDAAVVAKASIEACERHNERVMALVTDADGHLRAALSSDNATGAGFRSAPLKTATVLAFHASTRDLATRLTKDPAFAAQYGKDPRYFYHAGALPIFRNGKFVAVVAVGGGHDQDEACASEGLKLLPWAKTSP